MRTGTSPGTAPEGGTWQGAAGGSGVVILKVANANAATVTTSGTVSVDTSTVTGYTIYKFTGDGVFSSG
jgi:hypothetical protein